jgi:hypothetical protein
MKIPKKKKKSYLKAQLDFAGLRAIGIDQRKPWSSYFGALDENIRDRV